MARIIDSRIENVANFGRQPEHFRIENRVVGEFIEPGPATDEHDGLSCMAS
jgi:hypothetical protein